MKKPTKTAVALAFALSAGLAFGAYAQQKTMAI